MKGKELEPTRARKRRDEGQAGKLSGLGSVDFWLNHPGVIGYTSPGEGRIPLTAEEIKTSVRQGLADARRLLPDASVDARETARDCIGRRLEESSALGLHRVINATGIILHTNLGRAPMHPELVKLASEIASGYTNLEYGITEGGRMGRLKGLESTLCELSGAESALVVNNCAGALFLVLSALAGNPFSRGEFVTDLNAQEWRGHPSEVVISRGELVQIGGGFRIPTILKASGATLVEVGTTNVTTEDDYARAISESTALILKVHASNFTQRGFTGCVETPTLSRLAHEKGVPLVEDIGSATLADTRLFPHIYLTTPQPTLKAGADIVCFSGDKLLGGPQAGIILGKKAHLERIRSHPVMRALRVDKWTGALLGALLWALGNSHTRYLPVLEMASRDAEKDKRRAQRIKRRADGAKLAIEIVEHECTLGGGTLPGGTYKGFALSIEKKGRSSDELATRLRGMTPPVVGIVKDGKFLLNMRTLLPGDDPDLARALKSL